MSVSHSLLLSQLLIHIWNLLLKMYAFLLNMFAKEDISYELIATNFSLGMILEIYLPSAIHHQSDQCREFVFFW